VRGAEAALHDRNQRAGRRGETVTLKAKDWKGEYNHGTKKNNYIMTCMLELKLHFILETDLSFMWTEIALHVISFYEKFWCNIFF
jgi:hypothetical protein